jgi:intracellular multiplication protein IcmK
VKKKMTKQVCSKSLLLLTMTVIAGMVFPHFAMAQATPPAMPVAAAPANPIPMMAPQSSTTKTEAAPAPAQQPDAAPAPAQSSESVPSLAQTLTNKVTDVAKNLPGLEAITGAEATPPAEPLEMPGMALPVDAGTVEAPAEPDAAREAAADEMRQEAFEAMMTGLLPLQPPQIRDALTRMDLNQKAIEEPLAYPKPELTFTTISLDPGSTPLTFKLATGHVTTVTFLDITGAPWPIKDVTWAGNFEVKAPTSEQKDDKFYLPPNVLRIIPLSEYAYGNVSMRLVGLPTPVTFTLRTGREVVQYRLDIRIPEMGPFAEPPLIEGGVTGLTAGDAMLTRVMEGVVPSSAEKLSVSGVDGRTTVYRMDGVVYVRTPLTLLSPGWNSSVRSADGMNVYAINSAPVLLLSDEGRMIRAQITDTAGEDDE